MQQGTQEHRMITLFSHRVDGKEEIMGCSHPVAVRPLLEQILLVQRYVDRWGSESRLERRSCRIAKRVAAARVETSILS